MSELFLVAGVAGQAVAVPADQVDSVVDIGEVVPVPRAGAHIRGLAALRSRVVTVIDTAAAIGLPPAGSARRAIITRVEGHHYAMLVDALDDVRSFEAAPLAPGLTLSGAWAGIANGVVERDGDALLVIDLAAVVPGPGVGHAIN